MRRWLLLLLVASTAAPLWAQQGRGPSHRAPAPQSLRLILAPHVAEELDALADTLRLETIRCLIGVVQGKNATIDLAYQPPIDASTANSVNHQSCPAATLALWHNHPRIPGEEPEYACYLSATDIREAVRPAAPPIQIVQVRGDVACWWSQWEIAQSGLLPVLFPRPRQRWGRPIGLDEAACRGELRGVVACMLLLACEHGAGAVAECQLPGPRAELATLRRKGPETRSSRSCPDPQPDGEQG
jgi:hypothetical protein